MRSSPGNSLRSWCRGKASAACGFCNRASRACRFPIRSGQSCLPGLTNGGQSLNNRQLQNPDTIMPAPRTLYDKIWDDHLVHEAEDGTALIYIDRHLVHEVTSPQAFEGLRLAGRKVRHPEKTLAVVDHNVPTTDRSHGIAEPESRLQVETLAQ